MHPEDRVRVMDAWEDATRRSGTLRVDLRLRRADGTWRWFETVAVPVGGDGAGGDGEGTEWVGASTDVHARRLAEERLREANESLRREWERRAREAREAEARFAAYFHTAAEALLSVAVLAEGDRDRRFRHEAVNPAAEALTGLRREAVVGREAGAFLPPATAVALEGRYRLVADGAGPQVFEAAVPLGGGGDGGEDEAVAPPLGVMRLTVVPAGDGPQPGRLLVFLRPAGAAGGSGGEVVVRFDPGWRRDR